MISSISKKLLFFLGSGYIDLSSLGKGMRFLKSYGLVVESRVIPDTLQPVQSKTVLTVRLGVSCFINRAPNRFFSDKIQAFLNQKRSKDAVFGPEEIWLKA